jgi:hypothetical protein
MADTKDLQERLFAEMRGRIKESDMSVPSKYNGYWWGVVEGRARAPFPWGDPLAPPFLLSPAFIASRPEYPCRFDGALLCIWPGLPIADL